MGEEAMGWRRWRRGKVGEEGNEERVGRREMGCSDGCGECVQDTAGCMGEGVRREGLEGPPTLPAMSPRAQHPPWPFCSCCQQSEMTCC